MADSKITALTSIGASTDPANDPLVLVDVSDTSMAATGTTKKVTLNQLLGASGTATLASATITGAATVGTTLGVTGVTTLTGNAFANGSYTIATGTPGAFTNSALTVNNRSGIGDLSAIAFGYRPNGTVLNGAAYIGYIGTNDAGVGLGDLIFGTRNVTTDTAPTERIRVTAAGNVNVVTGNVVMSTSGKGIDFSATASGSGTMTSELLNDYEEGTFTATLKGSVSDPTTPVTSTGSYVKVGRLVTITFAYSNVNTTGASGNVTVTGLPFSGALTGAGSVITFDMFTTSTTLACWNVGTTIAFYVSGGFIPATHNAGASRSINLTMTYFV